MKALITGAMACTLAASAQAADPLDSWIALSSLPNVRPAVSDDERSFAADSGKSDLWHGAEDWDAGSGLDGRGWSVYGHHRRGEGEWEDLEKDEIPSAAPEPSTSQLLTLGVVMLGLLRRISRSMHRN